SCLCFINVSVMVVVNHVMDIIMNHKLLKDLKELAEYDQSTRTDRPIFLSDNEDHPVQNKESLENSFEENVASKTNQEPPHDSDIHQLIEECCVEASKEQKQKMEDTILEMVKICQEKEFLCIHYDVDDLIKSSLNSKLLLINPKSQRLEKKEHEVKNVVEQAERRNRAEKSLQNFRIIHKISISFKNTSKISSIHSVAPIQSTKEPEHLLSMGYEHFSITPETESDEVTESNAESLLPISSKCEVTLEDEIEYEINSDKLDPHCFNVESDFVESLLNHDTFIEFSSKFDFSGELAHIKPEIPKFDFDFEEEIRLIENLLYDNSFPRSPEELNAEIADTIIESIHLSPIPVQDGEADLFLFDNSIPPGIENVADDPEGDVRFLEELLINDSILSHKSFDSNFEENSSIPRPPPEPPDVESFFDLKPDMIAEEISDKHNEDKCFDPGREINVSTKIKDDDYNTPSKSQIPKSDFDFEEEIRLIENLLYDNSFPRPPEELNAKIAGTIIESIPLLPIPVQDGNSQQEEIDIITETDDVLPPSVENDDDSSDDPLLGEADLFLSDNSIPPGIENFVDYPEGDIRFLEELLIDDSIISHESSDSNFKDNLLIPRPPPEPLDVESFFDLKPDVITEEISDKLN
nr:hypothetical protein [Tanacetum cinerariifolium]